MRGESVKNPNTGEVGDWTEVRKFNLMFQTNQGITQDSSTVVYMRPETAQGIFVNFSNITRSSRKRYHSELLKSEKHFAMRSLQGILSSEPVNSNRWK